MPDPRPLAPAACRDMTEVRAGVDTVDRELVRLLALRQGYMEAAARIKTDRNRVYDAARIEDVVAKVRRAAHEAGLSDAIAEPVWRVLIAQSIDHEMAQWDRLRPGTGEAG